MTVGSTAGSTACVTLLGGSYDPVHMGHVALGTHFSSLLHADELRVIPAGAPWQKSKLGATGQQRAEMASLAFAGLPLPVMIDRQEIERSEHGQASYTIDTLRQVRAELGARASIVFLMGADQLQRLATWREWQQLFEYAHICVAARPGFALNDTAVPQVVADEFSRRLGSLDSIRNTPHGLTYLAQDFAVDISATEIRAALQRGNRANSLVSPLVLDYIEQHNLYKS